MTACIIETNNAYGEVVIECVGVGMGVDVGVHLDVNVDVGVCLILRITSHPHSQKP